MIPRFTDHAANERTYLAWVRTAIAIMAFGFVIERFDLFLAYLGHNAGLANHVHAAQAVGLALIVLAALIVVAATMRYLHHRKAINDARELGYGSAVGDTLLGIMLACLGVFLIVYLVHQLLHG